MLIADALASVLYYYDSEEAFVYSLVDYTLLLYFSDVYVTIKRRDTGESVLCSLPPQDRVYRGVKEPIGMPVHVLDALHHRGVEFIVAPLDDTLPTKNLIEAVFARLHDTDPRSYARALDLVVLHCEARAEQVVPRDLPVIAISDGEAAQMLQRFNAEYWEAAQESLKHAASALSLNALRGDAVVDRNGSEIADRALNLFTVVRYRPSTRYERTVAGPNGNASYLYTQRILLTREQKEWATQCEHDAGEILSAPAGPRSRMIADTVLESGMISCGAGLHVARTSVKRRDVADGIPDERRHALETRLYATLGNDLRIVYMPIHVGGTPWLALYSFAGGDESWHHYLRLYRQIVPLLAERARRAATQAFIDVLFDVVLARISERSRWSDETVAAINASWTKASLVFPFPAPVLVSAELDTREQGGDSKPDFELGSRAYWISESAGRALFPRQVTLGTKSGVQQALRTAIRQAIHDEYERRTAGVRAILNIGHELQNALAESKWNDIAEAFRRRSAAELADETFRRYAEQRLRHLQWPMALASLVAMCGKAVLQADALAELRGKLLSNADEFRHSAGSIASYRLSVQYVVAYFLALARRDQFNVRVLPWTEGRSLAADLPATEIAPLFAMATVLSGNDPMVLELSRLRFPPIRPNNNLCVATACLLAEPIRNAAHALNSESDASSHPMLMWSVTERDGVIDVQIGNTVPRPTNLEARRNTTQLVTSLGQTLGIGSVSLAEHTVLSKDDLSIAVATVSLHPQLFGLQR